MSRYRILLLAAAALVALLFAAPFAHAEKVEDRPPVERPEPAPSFTPAYPTPPIPLPPTGKVPWDGKHPGCPTCWNDQG